MNNACVRRRLRIDHRHVELAISITRGLTFTYNKKERTINALPQELYI